MPAARTHARSLVYARERELAALITRYTLKGTSRREREPVNAP